MVYIERDIEKDLNKWIEDREILAIRGPRQCGKTTILNRIRENLIKKGVSEKNIHYINFEDNVIRLKFEENWRDFINLYLTNGKNYFLIDEVQYVKDIGKKLKLIFDSFNNIKIIITGSSSFDLTNLGQYLVGRVLFFNLLPFNFREFLRAKDEKYERLYNQVKIDLEKIKLTKTIFLEDLNSLLHEYLTFGGYPRVILENDREKKKEILKNMFTTYVEKDVVSLYGNKYRDNSVKILKTLSANLGGIIKYENLTEVSGLKYSEIKEILPILQDSFVISIVNPFYKNLVSELRKNPKIYFVDMGIRNYLYEKFDNLDFDYLYENFVYNQLKVKFNIKYWRTTTKTEVDFVIDKSLPIPIEVKRNKKVTRALRSFIKNYKSEIVIVANLKIAEKIEKSIYAIPFVYF
ncbi:MAG: ATP-binding protein [Nanoarchaeota archaeon]|nr:ATP-binding protein [Nanoarchaeota archaeon]